MNEGVVLRYLGLLLLFESVLYLFLDNYLPLLYITLLFVKFKSMSVKCNNERLVDISLIKQQMITYKKRYKILCTSRKATAFSIKLLV